MNQGALATNITIKGEAGIDIGTVSVKSISVVGAAQVVTSDRMNLEKSLKQIIFKKKHKINGYSNLQIPFEFVPTEIGSFSLRLQLEFENFFHSPAISIDLKSGFLFLFLFNFQGRVH